VLRSFGHLVSLSVGNCTPAGGGAAGFGEFAMNFLYAAYAATWVIHIVYLGSLVRRYVHLRKEVDELKRL
jgi:CcmD family protein